MKKSLLAVAVFATVVFAAEGAGAFSDKVYKELDTFSKVMEIVDRYYVEAPDEKKLLEGAIKGMLYTLDPHTVYLPAQMYKDFKSDTQGRFGGIGIEVTVKDGFITVVAPIEGSPAQRAGIRSGDKILMINGRITKGMDLTEAVHMMRGTIGKRIVLSVWRKGYKQAKQITIGRELIRVASVASEDLGDGYIYLRINSFQEGTARHLKRAVNGFRRASGKDIAGVILDLRDNPGGLLTEAIKISDFFLDGGVIVSTKGRDRIQEVKKARKTGTFSRFPMVVLINKGSASASEIVAGALQDHGRAKLLGTKSYGKGSVQTVINLDDGDAVKITVARYYTPKNRMIDGKGIRPDVVIGRKEFEKSSTGASTKETSPAGAPSTTPLMDAYKNFQKSEALSYLKRMH